MKIGLTIFFIVVLIVVTTFVVLGTILDDSDENCEYCKWNQELIKM